jgi:NADP-dependent 3-hydroxy acid dehydrogenase YdfG
MGLIMIVLAILGIKLFSDKIKSFFIKPTFKNKRVWITGGSSGIGEELTKQFIELGAEEVIISARNVKEMERVKSECKDPKRVTIFALDMSRSNDLMEKSEQFIKKLESEGKKLDIIVENAGVSQRSFFKDYDFANHEYMTQLNYHGPVAHTKVILPHLMKNKSG